MRQGFFESSTVRQRADQDEGQRLMTDSPVRVRAIDFMDADMHEGSDEELINGTRQMRARQNARLNNARRRLTRTDEMPEELEDDSGDEEDFEENERISRRA
jgi:hypothetical protein